MPMHRNKPNIAYLPTPPSAAYMRQWIGLALVQITAWRQIGDTPLSEPVPGNCQLDPYT